MQGDRLDQVPYRNRLAAQRLRDRTLAAEKSLSREVHFPDQPFRIVTI